MLIILFDYFEIAVATALPTRAKACTILVQDTCPLASIFSNLLPWW